MQKIALLDSLIHFNAGASLLDIGCGGGETAMILSKLYGMNVHGIDISPDALDKCRELMETYHFDMELACSSGAKIEYKDNTFDYSLNFGVLEHSHDPDKELNENYRVLSDNGVAIYVIPNNLSLAPICRNFLMIIRKWPFGYQKEISCKKLKKMMEAAGFTNVISFAKERNRANGDVKLGKRIGWYTFSIGEKHI
jgi:SAM-dependent methyltransferase